MSLKRPSADDVPITEQQQPQTAKRSKMAGEPDFIDENLHSRQLAVYGRDAFRKFQTASVLVAGMNALGVEVGERGSRSADRGAAGAPGWRPTRAQVI